MCVPHQLSSPAGPKGSVHPPCASPRPPCLRVKGTHSLSSLGLSRLRSATLQAHSDRTTHLIVKTSGSKTL